MPIAVITDSTAYLPEGFASRHGIDVVPLHVLIDGITAMDGVEVSPEMVVSALKQHKNVSTSRPTPTEFVDRYRAALAAGADGVVSLHLSAEISGTWEAAVMAAEQVGADKVRVVDTRTTAMGLGFAVLRAARKAAVGGSASDVEAVAVSAAQRSSTFFVVDTLEYLRRGGRITAGSALVGTALAVKPLLHIAAGQISPLEKVRTVSRAVMRMVELAVTAADGKPVDVAVHHLASPERAVHLAQELEDKLVCPHGCLISEVGAVIGAHTGPGALGVVVQPIDKD